jgi:hypothetical protein
MKKLGTGRSSAVAEGRRCTLGGTGGGGMTEDAGGGAERVGRLRERGRTPHPTPSRFSSGDMIYRPPRGGTVSIAPRGGWGRTTRPPAPRDCGLVVAVVPPGRRRGIRSMRGGDGGDISRAGGGGKGTFGWRGCARCRLPVHRRKLRRHRLGGLFAAAVSSGSGRARHLTAKSSSSEHRLPDP